MGVPVGTFDCEYVEVTAADAPDLEATVLVSTVPEAEFEGELL